MPYLIHNIWTNTRGKNRKFSDKLGEQNTPHNRYSTSGDEDSSEYEIDLELEDVFQSLDDENYEMNNRYGSSDYDFDLSEDYNGRKTFQQKYRDGKMQEPEFFSINYKKSA